ncbi:hypothetical protein SLS62_006221 [Diatrype stigma]|uniref:VOC domain-containing protein n=1 Tax=Diatrype stigma TaxID=117547 RepID=A0AAN9UNL7_9PEZI
MAANGSPSSGKVISPSKLAHVVLRTPNFKAMTAFYKAFLGARASFENDDMAFLSYDAEHHRIAIIAQPGCGPRVPDAAGLHHIAFTFDTLADLVTAYQQRRAREILPLWCVNHGPTTSIYYQDPDGNHLETQVDNFDDMAAGNAFVSGPQFAENPIGVDFDPDELASRLRAGEPEAELKKRPDIGPRTAADMPARFTAPPPPDIRESYEPVGVST